MEMMEGERMPHDAAGPNTLNILALMLLPEHMPRRWRGLASRRGLARAERILGRRAEREFTAEDAEDAEDAEGRKRDENEHGGTEGREVHGGKEERGRQSADRRGVGETRTEVAT